MSVSSEVSELDRRERWARNGFVALFVGLIVTALVVLTCGILSIVYPDAGIPFFWMAFPVGPQPVPMS
jgi:cytochrome b561